MYYYLKNMTSCKMISFPLYSICSPETWTFVQRYIKNIYYGKNCCRFTILGASVDASPRSRRRAGPPRTAASLKLPKKNKSSIARLAWSSPRKRRRFGGVVVAARGASRALVASRRLRRRVASIGRGGHLGGPGPCREADTLETV